jgi:UDP:flavonoid glycosyltransferase YjiC (YdhE family)
VYRLVIDLWDKFHLTSIRNRVFKKYGCEPVDAKALFSASRVISPGLADFDHYIKEFPQWEAVGPIWGKLPSTRPDWMDTLDNGEPTVYISFGSTGDLDRFLRKSYEALANSPYRFVVTTGGQLPKDTEAMAPDNFLFADYAPGDEIIKHCKALVFHGGNGTMYQALAAGVPMIALPHTEEQDINARLCDLHGFGKRLKPRHGVGERLILSLDEIIENPGYTEAARHYAELIQASPGVERAADIILESVRQGARPPLDGAV